MTRLEIAEQKLKRLEREFDEATQSAYSHMNQANGQPMNDKRNGGTFFKKTEQLENRIFNKIHEIEAQKERISSLKDREFRKENHLTANYGLQTSVHNIEEFKARKQDSATRKKVKTLEAILEKSEKDKLVLSDCSKQLIASGKVSQWTKMPIYYFVAGLRKTALVVNDNGDFVLSKKYPAKNEAETQFVLDLLGGDTP